VYRLARRVVIALVVALAAAGPALGDLVTEKQAVDQRIDRLRDRIAAAKERETVLTSDIAAASEQIAAVQGRVDELAAHVDDLQRELDRHEARLAELRQLLERQAEVLRVLEHNERRAQERLAARVVEIYESDRPGTIEVLLSVTSLDELLSQLQYLEEIAARDQEIATDVAAARAELAAERRRTQQLEQEEAATTAALAARTAEQRAALGEIIARRNELATAQADREAILGNIREERHEHEEDIDALERASEELAERIRRSQSSSGGASRGTGAAPSSGFIWPVNGPLTSPYGMRWGRLHAGIDIGVGFGTPIRAAASGTVIYAGWLGGYGNLVVIDHGAGLSTAYGHQQQISVSNGQQVAQGTVIGEVGSTGNSTGPHLHFEVRVNGSAVDPLGYL
jgi:murein DD-endopeptidase MepM/ murein hydrolase activator NlpD